MQTKKKTKTRTKSVEKSAAPRGVEIYNRRSGVKVEKFNRHLPRHRDLA